MLDPHIIQAFVISLPSASARRVRIRGCLTGNITYEIVDAIAGSALKDDLHEYCSDQYFPRFYRYLTLNEVACSVSHRNALERFMASTARFGLILEDDAHIDLVDFNKILNVAAAMEDFDITKIGGWGKYISEGVALTDCQGVRIAAVVTFGVCSHAYIVSRSGAQKLINSILPVRAPYDSFLRNVHVHQCNIYETSPWLSSLQPEYENSMIGDRRVTYRRPLAVWSHLRAMFSRLQHNTGTSVFNLRRFGLAYLTKKGFSKRLPSGM